MAIVKATYTKSSAGAKASIRYIEHRPGKDGATITRPSFNSDGLLGRWQAYRIIDEAEQGSFFYRFALSPDPKREDTQADLFLREITQQTMNMVEDHLNTRIQWVAAVHADHAPHRHVHIVAVVPQRLQVQDFQQMRLVATEAALAQRRQRDLGREHQAREREGGAWER